MARFGKIAPGRGKWGPKRENPKKRTISKDGGGGLVNLTRHFPFGYFWGVSREQRG